MIRKTATSLALAAVLSAPAWAAETARYVRIELPGKNRILTLAEVEVISSGKNIAPKGKASQSSTASSGDASRATDGNKNPSYNANGQTHRKHDSNCNSQDQWSRL